MMKTENIKQKILLLTGILLALGAVLCWPVVFRNAAANEREYRECVEKAKVLSSKGIYADAIACLRKAEQKRPAEAEDLLLLARCLKKTEDEECILVCNRVIAKAPKEEAPYLLQVEWYLGTQSYDGAYATLETARKNGCDSASLAAMQTELDNLFLRQYIGGESVSSWHLCGTRAYAVFSSADRFGLLRGDGKVSVNAEYSALGMYDPETGTLPAMHEGTLCFVDAEGNRKLVPDTPADELGSFGNGLAPFRANGEAGYLDRDMQVKMQGLSYAGAFAEGVAAVKQNGKWALLDAHLNNLTPFSFEDILVDSYGFCLAYGRGAVKKEGLWYLSDAKGALLSAGADAVAFPASATEDIAFCKDGKWGFMNRDGEVTVPPCYDGAGSFSLGLAPVKQGEQWMYIRPDGSMAGTDTFAEAGTFSPDGRAVVEKNNAVYLLVMSKYWER